MKKNLQTALVALILLLLPFSLAGQNPQVHRNNQVPVTTIAGPEMVMEIVTGVAVETATIPKAVAHPDPLGDEIDLVVILQTEGEDLWSFSGDTLTIHTVGPMRNYSFPWLTPWHSLAPATRHLVLEDGVTSVGRDAFSMGFDNLISINIGSGLTSVTFTNLPLIGPTLTAINVSPNNLHFNSESGVLFNKAMDTLIRYPANRSGSSYIIPNSVIAIGDNAFRSGFGGAGLLNSVTIPSSVISIGEHAFMSRSGLTSVTYSNPKTPK